jgi:hypothetical protein
MQTILPYRPYEKEPYYQITKIKLNGNKNDKT